VAIEIYYLLILFIFLGTNWRE